MMSSAERRMVSCLLLACAVSGCPPRVPPPGTSDSTPPQLVEVLAEVVAPSPPNPRGSFNITSTDINKTQLPSDLSIRLVATAGDAESGIASITLQSELRWRCAFGAGSETIGTLQTAPLAFSPVTQPSAPITPFQINAVVNPIAQTGCNMSSPGKGPVDVAGFVRVTATNGVGVTVTSKTFLFEYADVGVRQ